MKTLKKDDAQVDYEREIKESFELFKLKEREILPYTGPERFARDNFKRCDKMQYAHTRYSVTTSAIE